MSKFTLEIRKTQREISLKKLKFFKEEGISLAERECCLKKSAIELEHEKILEMKSQQHFFQLLLFQGFHPNVHWLAKKHYITSAREFPSSFKNFDFLKLAHSSINQPTFSLKYVFLF